MSIDSHKITAVIVAAGASSRMKTDKSKTLLDIFGKTVIRRTLEVFNASDCIDDIVLVSRQQDVGEMTRQAGGIDKLCKIVCGGDDRQSSVLNGVLAADGDFVAIHDGARPLVTAREIQRVCCDAVKWGAATLCVVPKDTVKLADNEGFVEATPDRASLRLIATPQVFGKKDYLACCEKAGNNVYTDDCQLFESCGRRVFLTQGEYTNIKITTPEDISFAGAIIDKKNEGGAAMRIGHGYDVHKLVNGRKLIVGGVDIPNERGLLGHSDADVLLHAIADSLLGAAALGDIGCLFPDTSAEFEGADSLLLLSRVVGHLESNGYRIVNIDATVVAQAPKLSPYIGAMRGKIAEACNISADCVSVKATTEEKLGFTGREEGISAHSVCLISKIL